MLQALVLFAGVNLAQEAPITLPPKLRTFAQLAQELATSDRIVRVDASIAGDGCIVSVKDRSFDAVSAGMSQALGVRLRKDGENNWILEPDSAQRTQDQLLYNEFIAKTNADYQDIFKRMRAVSGSEFPGNMEALSELIDEETRDPSLLTADDEPRPDRIYSSPLFKSKLPWREKAALALAFGATTSNIREYKITGPVLVNAMKNGFRQMIPNDLVQGGDGYFWRDWSDMPGWVKYRAVAHLRQFEADMKASSAPAQQSRAEFNRKAQAHYIIHRSYFEPLNGSVGTEFSVTNPVAGVSWYDEGEVIPLDLRFDIPFLARLNSATGQDADFKKRLASTEEILDGDEMAKPFSRTTNGYSLADAIVDFAKETGAEVIADYSPIRDQCLSRMAQPASQTTSWKDGAAWMRVLSQSEANNWAKMAQPYRVPFGGDRTYGPLISQSTTPAWSLQKQDGILLVRNEMRFLDSKYSSLPLEPLWTLKAAAKPIPETLLSSVSLDELIAYAKGTNLNQNKALAKSQDQIGVYGLGAAWPFVHLFDSFSARQRQTIIQTLKEKKEISISFFAGISQIARARLVNELRGITYASATANMVHSAYRHMILRPDFDNYLAHGTLTISVSDEIKSSGARWMRFSLEMPVGDGYMIEFSSKDLLNSKNSNEKVTADLNELIALNKNVLKQIQSRVYMDEVGPVRL